MKVKFWGCRGSLPSSYKSESANYKLRYVLEQAIANGLNQKTDLEAFIEGLPFGIRSTYGTNTPCVEIQGGDEIIICDAGSGIRDLGKDIVSNPVRPLPVINIIMSHLHWDHLQGFPFFIPAYIQGSVVRIWGCHADLEKAFTDQQNSPFFPVRLNDMGAHISFHALEAGKSYSIGGIQITPREQPHPGLSYGYSFESHGRKIVYSTDIEHQEDAEQNNPFLDFYSHADVLIMDGQFNLADHLHTMQNWGHSSNLMAIELATLANVKKLCLFHADHLLDDLQLDKFFVDSKRYHEIYASGSDMQIVLAYDGMVLDTGN